MEQQWKKIIKPKAKRLDFKFKEVLQYKDLIFMFVKRSFTVRYKQTILGPLWYIIHPLITTVLFTAVFGGIAKISTDGVPQFLFYMAGNTAWQYFASCVTGTSTTFTSNAHLFGKVYFPRLTMPIANVISTGISFLIQFVMLLGFMVYFACIGEPVHPNIHGLWIPLLVVHMAALGLGVGIIVSALTTKYRDLSVLVTVGVSLWMYITPVVYPLSAVEGTARTLILLNPMTPIVCNFKYALLGCGEMQWGWWGVSALVTLALLCVGVVLFNRVERTFMDTV